MGALKENKKEEQAKDKNLISIIMPVYNRQNTIIDAIKSVLSQTYSKFELIIINDASNDRTLEMINSIDDPRIKYINLTRNVGAAVARNIGIQQSEGRWIAFQDSDDIWFEDKLLRQMSVIKKNGYVPSITYTSFTRDKQGKTEYIPGNEKIKREGYIQNELLTGNFIALPTAIVARECFETEGNFAEDMPRFQDWELWIRLSARYPFYWIDEPLVHVNYTENSISSDPSKLLKAYKLILEKHEEQIIAAPTHGSRFLFSYGHNLLLSGEMREGRKYLMRSIALSQTLISYISFLLSFLGCRVYRFFYFVRGLLKSRNKRSTKRKIKT
ncbi:glycosyltransferase family 2 protein [Paenibacillus senegalensis]|uniref:glycosyltransferase family 2 protein n=1 Tax=Paenibacillus senegalensis TaxID=1465766 RepID=UPI0002893D04|nr:glycosyltransferase family 2 protein [Paenibacillus senegalensis]